MRSRPASTARSAPSMAGKNRPTWKEEREKEAAELGFARSPTR